MSKNSAEAFKLIDRLNKIPTMLGAAVGRAAYSAVLNNTLQDSGQAAFNWRADINTTRVLPFRSMRGVAPVGATGDKRSAGFDRELVIRDRFENFLARLVGKDIKFIHLYNETPDPDYAHNARLEEARAVADNPDWLEDVARAALKNANL